MFPSKLIRRGALLALACAAPPASAAVRVEIDNVFVFAGTTQTARVGVYANSDFQDLISGFNLPLDFNNDGTAPLPAGFSLPAAADVTVNEIYADTAFDTPQPQITLIGADGIPTGSGPNVQLFAGNTKLFDLQVIVDASVPVGTVLPLSVFVPAAPFTPLFNIAGPNDPAVAAPVAGTPVFGSITVIDIPEPGALALVAGAAVLARRVRRKK